VTIACQPLDGKLLPTNVDFWVYLKEQGWSKFPIDYGCSLGL